MTRLIGNAVLWACIFPLSLMTTGCGGNSEPVQPSETTPAPAKVRHDSVERRDAGKIREAVFEVIPDELETDIQPVSLRGLRHVPGILSPPSNVAATGDEDVERVWAELQPLHILVGKWEGVTRKAIGGAIAIEEPQWEWDFLTNKNQPALVVTSKTSPYVKKGRLTFLVNKQVFQFTTSDRSGVAHVYEGMWQQPVRDTPDDSKILQRTFQLKLVQIDPVPDFEELVFHQQDNSRYLLEVYRRRGGELKHYDTVDTQRYGPTFSLNPYQYRGKMCIVSQGPGTEQIIYQGSSYWVCCNGCKAAFEENPERWIVNAPLRRRK